MRKFSILYRYKDGSLLDNNASIYEGDYIYESKRILYVSKESTKLLGGPQFVVIGIPIDRVFSFREIES